MLRINPSIDPFVGSGNAADQRWIINHWWRMMVYSPWFDKKTSWYPGGWLYKDSSGIYPKQKDVLGQHPDWVLKDSSGNWLFIQYNCKPDQNMCSHYSADVGNPAYREWWIQEARKVLNRGYKGLWIDDVNMSWRISNGKGEFINPVDPRSGQLMSEDDWRRYTAEFMEQIRRELPDIEIVQNAIWFAGPKGVRDLDTNIRRQNASADYINNEHGIYGNKGLRGGTGEWSYDTRLSYYDRIHATGEGVIIDEVAPESNTPDGREFSLATYFLISNGSDGIGNQQIHNSSEWWKGYDVNLGEPVGPRKQWKGVYRRDYSGGMALVNPPETQSRTLKLDGSFITVDGETVQSITLGPKQGAVLLRQR